MNEKFGSRLYAALDALPYDDKFPYSDTVTAVFYDPNFMKELGRYILNRVGGDN